MFKINKQLFFVLLASGLLFQFAQAEITGVDAIALSVRDMKTSLDFYTRVLPFRKVFEQEMVGPETDLLYGVFGVRVKIVRLQLGDEFIELRQFLAPEGKSIPEDSRSHDRWFQHFAIIVSDMEKAYAHLRKHSVRHASTGPQTLPNWNPAAGGIQAFYFKDPDGHPVEILSFPSGKGDPKWHRKGARELFLGIDHTAIVVASTERSLIFYRDQLGLTVQGASENYGTEQEHLNHVKGARLRITGLRAPHGPGVEFLEYLSPKDGRLYPSAFQPNDLVYTQTIFTTSNIHDESHRLQPSQEAQKGFSATDPDGHGVLLIEKGVAQ